MAKLSCLHTFSLMALAAVLTFAAVPAFASGGVDTLAAVALGSSATEYSQPIETGDSIGADSLEIANVSVSGSGSVVVRAFGGVCRLGCSRR